MASVSMIPASGQIDTVPLVPAVSCNQVQLQHNSDTKAVGRAVDIKSLLDAQVTTLSQLVTLRDLLASLQQAASLASPDALLQFVTSTAAASKATRLASPQHSAAAQQFVLQEQAAVTPKQTQQQEDSTARQHADATGSKAHAVRLQEEADGLRTQLQALQQQSASQLAGLTSQLQQAGSAQQSSNKRVAAFEDENSCLRAEVSKLQAMLAQERAQHALTMEREQQVTGALLAEQQRHSSTQAALTTAQQQGYQESIAAGILRSHAADSEDAIAWQHEEIARLQEGLSSSQDAAVQQQADLTGSKWQATRLQAEVNHLRAQLHAQHAKAAAQIGQLSSQLQQAVGAKQLAVEQAACARAQHAAAAAELEVAQMRLGCIHEWAAVLAEQLRCVEESMAASSLRSSSEHTISELEQQLNCAAHMMQQQQQRSGATPAGPAGKASSCDDSSGIGEAVCGADALARSRDWGSGLSSEALAVKGSSGGVSDAGSDANSFISGVRCSSKVAVRKLVVVACLDDESEDDVDVFFDVADCDGCACAW